MYKILKCQLMGQSNNKAEAARIAANLCILGGWTVEEGQKQITEAMILARSVGGIVIVIDDR